MSQRTANFLCLLVALIWGGGFLATDLALDTFDPCTMLAIRFTGAAAVCWIPCFFVKDKISRALIGKGILSGTLLYLAFAFQTIGLFLTETGMNAFLTAVNVVLVPYIAWLFLKQKPSLKAVAGSLLCLAGIGCLSLSSGSFQFRLGDVFSLLCAVFFAGQIVALSGVHNENPWLMNAIQLTTAAVLSVPVAVLFGTWPSVISSGAVLSCLYSIFMATFVCYLLQTWAQKYTSCSTASVLLCTESLWANLLGWLILHEKKTWIMLFGGLLIFISILIVESPSSKEKQTLSQTASQTDSGG